MDSDLTRIKVTGRGGPCHAMRSLDVAEIDVRNETDEQVTRSEARFRAAIGAIEGYLWTNSAAGEMIGDQQGWQALTGQIASEYYGFGWTSAVHPDDVAATIAAWNAAVASRSLFSHEHRVRRSDGEWRDFSVRAVPILDSRGEIVEWVGIHTDITVQQRAKATLVVFNDELESRVRTELAARLEAEKALRQSQKMNALGQLTGGIAHDFNNMLSVTSSAFDLLQRRFPDPDADTLKLFEAGRDAVARAARLTSRMLTFARQQPETPEVIDINEAIVGVEELITHSLGVGITVEYRLSQESWKTLIDRNQLDNAILNLIVNARDAINEHGQIIVETRNVALTGDARTGGLKGDFIQLSVTDNGAGMSIDVQAKAFDPFFTTKPAGQGTGLGLSQVYGFVRQADGKVTISSELGKGTRVELYLPRVN